MPWSVWIVALQSCTLALGQHLEGEKLLTHWLKTEALLAQPISTLTRVYHSSSLIAYHPSHITFSVPSLHCRLVFLCSTSLQSSKHSFGVSCQTYRTLSSWSWNLVQTSCWNSHCVSIWPMSERLFTLCSKSNMCAFEVETVDSLMHHRDAQGNKLPNHTNLQDSPLSRRQMVEVAELSLIQFRHYQPVLERIPLIYLVAVVLLHIAIHFVQTRSIRRFSPLILALWPVDPSADESWTL